MHNNTFVFIQIGIRALEGFLWGILLCRDLEKSYQERRLRPLNRYLSVYKNKIDYVTGVLVLLCAIIFDVGCNHCDELGLESLQTSALNRLRVIKQLLYVNDFVCCTGKRYNAELKRVTTILSRVVIYGSIIHLIAVSNNFQPSSLITLKFCVPMKNPNLFAGAAMVSMVSPFSYANMQLSSGSFGCTPIL